MKKCILALFLLGFMGSGHSQILLKETKVDYRPETMVLDSHSNSIVFHIPEKKYGEFEKDPLTFVKNHFDIQKIIKDNKKENYVSYRVDFKSNKGHLYANFNRNGKLVSSLQKFKNVKLPEAARLQILQEYRDAFIVKNNYVARSKGWEVKQEFYRVKLMDGNKTRRLKITKENGALTIAGL